MHRSRRIAIMSGLLALALVAGVFLSSWTAPRQLDAAPVDLSVPALAPDQLGQWCVDRKAQGTAGLSSRAKNWLTDCIAIFGTGLTPAPSGSPTPSPSATQTPSPSPSPTVQPSPSVTPTATTPPATTPPASPTPGTCPVAGRNVPGAADPWGGCWPGPGNTGVPAGTVLTAYTGSCTITVAGTVIDSKTVTCSTLLIQAAGVTIRKSLLQGTNVTNGTASGGSFTIEDSTVVNGARDQCECIGNHNFVARRVEVRGGNRSAYCAHDCVIEDSWLHGQQLQGAQHGSGLREEQRTTATHNVIVCDYPFTDDATSLGCSADLTGYPDFAPIHDNTIDRNLFLASITVSFCAYGGATNGKPSSSDPLNATNQRFTNNVFQRGGNGRCGFYGPITDFAVGRVGNVWSGNVWDSGEVVPAG
jgi:hypothetical protein